MRHGRGSDWGVLLSAAAEHCGGEGGSKAKAGPGFGYGGQGADDDAPAGGVCALGEDSQAGIIHDQGRPAKVIAGTRAWRESVAHGGVYPKGHIPGFIDTLCEEGTGGRVAEWERAEEIHRIRSERHTAS